MDPGGGLVEVEKEKEEEEVVVWWWPMGSVGGSSDEFQNRSGSIIYHYLWYILITNENQLLTN